MLLHTIFDRTAKFKRGMENEGHRCKIIRGSNSQYTQAYLAEFTGFSTSFISDLERGKTTAEIGKTITLINLLGLDLMLEKRG